MYNPFKQNECNTRIKCTELLRLKYGMYSTQEIKNLIKLLVLGFSFIKLDLPTPLNFK